MFLLRILMLSLLLCSDSYFVSAQTGWTTYNTANSGLPENNVQALALDSSGNKWIGTDGGLAMFDGTTWTIYNTSNSGLPANGIRSIGIDHTNNNEQKKFLGSQSNGLITFDGTNWIAHNTMNSGICNDHVNAVLKDDSGFVWVATSNGLSRWDENFLVTSLTSSPSLTELVEVSLSK